LKIIFSDKPTDPEDFHDKFNDILENVFIVNGLSYMSGWKRSLRLKCGFSVAFTIVFRNDADFYPYGVI
jgi:hypothetical protein